MTVHETPIAVAIGWNNPRLEDGVVVEGAATLPLIIQLPDSEVVRLLQEEYDGLHTGVYFLDASDLRRLRRFIKSSTSASSGATPQTLHEAEGLKDIMACFNREIGAPVFHIQPDSRLIMVVLCRERLSSSVPLLTLRVLLDDFRRSTAEDLMETGLDPVDLYRVTHEAQGYNAPVPDESIR